MNNLNNFCLSKPNLIKCVHSSSDIVKCILKFLEIEKDVFIPSCITLRMSCQLKYMLINKMSPSKLEYFIDREYNCSPHCNDLINYINTLFHMNIWINTSNPRFVGGIFLKYIRGNNDISYHQVETGSTNVKHRQE